MKEFTNIGLRQKCSITYWPSINLGNSFLTPNADGSMSFPLTMPPLPKEPIVAKGMVTSWEPPRIVVFRDDNDQAGDEIDHISVVAMTPLAA